MSALIECVPNFSEGRDPEVIRKITARIESVEGATLLHVDPGKATNRTVVTFAGAPDPVSEAACRAIAAACEVSDMPRHQGEHPRMGATDVCPLVPVSGITLEETAGFARRLAERVGRELGIPVYLYEAAQPDPKRRNLSVIREGEYEGLPRKLADPAWKPDFGPGVFVPRSGATAIGARGFLVAFNVNLNTTSTRRANAVAYDLRESGRPKRRGDRLVHRGVRHRPGFDDPHRPRRDAAARRVRGGPPCGGGKGAQGNRVGARGPRAARGDARRGAVLSGEAAALAGRLPGGAHQDRGPLARPRRAPTVPAGGTDYRIPPPGRGRPPARPAHRAAVRGRDRLRIGGAGRRLDRGATDSEAVRSEEH